MPRVLMGLLFYPRGGSAQVTRSLARALPPHGWDVSVLSGSLGHGTASDAQRFFAGLDVRAVDYTAAAQADDPLAADPPMHPSYEDRADAPDRVFARVGDAAYEHLVATWARELAAAGAREAEVLHLSHLTPLNEAAGRVAPDAPVVGHLHGTELLMLEEIEAGPPSGWDHAEPWAARMRAWAGACAQIVLLSATQIPRVEESLGVSADRCTVIPNGFDPEIFGPREIDRAAHWRRYLVDEPQGWAPGGEPGGVAYAEAAVAAIGDGPVLLYVGRYTAVKRIGLLIRAFARVRRETGTPASLVILGGFPGEWEGEHPLQTIEATGADSVFLAGWHEHEELPAFFAASDVVVLASVREQFGQVLVEGMASGLPAIAADAYGPREIVTPPQTGWLVEPDDEASLTAAIAQALADPHERARRGAAARTAVSERYSWPALAGRLAELYDAAGG